MAANLFPYCRAFDAFLNQLFACLCVAPAWRHTFGAGVSPTLLLEASPLYMCEVDLLRGPQGARFDGLQRFFHEGPGVDLSSLFVTLLLLLVLSSLLMLFPTSKAGFLL